MPEVVEELEVEETEVVEEEEVKEETKVEEKPTINIEELKKEFIEMVRKEEKDKLYKTMEKTKADFAAEKAAKEALEAKIKEYEEKNLSAEEKTDLKLEELAKANIDLKEQLERLSDTAAQQIYQVQLDAAKEKSIAKYGEEIIVQLVSGSTIEEIAQSAEKAHEEYKRITKQVEDKVVQERRQTTATSTITPKATENRRDFEVDISKITDPKEWEKVKSDLLEKARQG